MRESQARPGRLRAFDSTGEETHVAAFTEVRSPRRDDHKREQGGVRPWLAQLAVALTQAAFVVGSVYLKASLALVDPTKGEVFHPIVYAFAREVAAGPLLYICAYATTKVAAPARQDLGRVAVLGACMFFSQLFYITGIELSGVVVATCIQPTIPVFTVLLGVLLQMESANPQKLAGIALAAVGAMSMVLGGVNNGEEDSAAARKAASNMTLGNICLLVNTLAMACYYIQAKRLVAKYAPVQVAAWAYLVAATMMGSAALAFTTRADWNFPNALIMPLLYWITVCSIFGYYVVTWAMRHLPASQVAAFQCLQPFLGSLLAFAVLHEKLSWWDLGAVGVVAGLFLVSMDTKREAQVRSAVSRLRMMMTSRSSSSIILPRDSSPLIKVQAIA